MWFSPVHSVSGLPASGYDSRSSSPREPSAPSLLCQVLQPDLNRFAESWENINRRNIEDILISLQRVEAFWVYLTRKLDEGENDRTDRYLSEVAQDLEERIQKLERELEAIRDRHQRTRQAMLRENCQLRTAAVGPAVNGPGLILRMAAAVVDSERAALEESDTAASATAKGGQQQQQPLQSRSEPMSPSSDKLELDPRRLMDVEKFDPTDLGKEVAALATAAVRARVEAHRSSWQAKFEEDRGQLSAKICEVCESDRKEQQDHEVLVARLMAKFEASGKAPPGAPPSLALRGSIRGGNRGSLFPTSLRGSVVSPAQEGSSRHASKQAGSGRSSPFTKRQSITDGSGKRVSSKPRASTVQSRKQPTPEIEKELNSLRELFGAPLSEDKQVRQWGSMLVGHLGLNSYPTRPKRWDSCVSRSQRLCTPRVASTIGEAFPASLEFSPPGSSSLDGAHTFSAMSRHMFGSPPQGLEGLGDASSLTPTTAPGSAAHSRPNTHAAREKLATR